MKPLSGSGARGLMVDAMTTYGPDSFVGRLACIFQGSTDTTFYILAVYFGSVGIVKPHCGALRTVGRPGRSDCGYLYLLPFLWIKEDYQNTLSIFARL